MTQRLYFIGYEFGKEEYNLIFAGKTLELPMKAKNRCPKTSYNHFLAYLNDNDTSKILKHQMFKLTDEAHEFEITFEIDANHFPTFEVRNIIHEHILNFPQFCDSYNLLGNDIKTYEIIGILANRSFICVYKNGNFEFLESWGGQWGTPMHITFDKKKPEFGKVAEEILLKQGKYGVQDLLQVMAEGDNAATTITPHGYTFTKDKDHPILIEFETFDGTKKAASPEFLMAMLIKQQLKAIEKEIGKKPTKLGFCIFNVFTESNVKIALGKACELMKIKDFCFVPWK